MSQTLVNLDLYCVNQEVNSLLASGQENPYAGALRDPQLKQQLIAYVLSRITNTHVVIDDLHPPDVDDMGYSCSLEKRQQIVQLISEGLNIILKDNLEWIVHHSSEEAYPDYGQVSHWFG
jgi:hypothetical protein